MDTVWIDPVEARSYARRLEEQASGLPAAGTAPAGDVPAPVAAALTEIVNATTQGYDALREVGTATAERLHTVADNVEAADASPVPQ